MPNSQQFNADYSAYWEGLSSQAGRSSPPSASRVGRLAEALLGKRQKPFATGLDVACGHGRLSAVMTSLCEAFDGIEIEPTAARKARANKEYREVLNLPFEHFSAPEAYDFALCWAAFEVLDQSTAMMTLNRLLTLGGAAIISGKNANYFRDDSEAVSAELGASRKGFVQSFTDTSMLERLLSHYGFDIRGVLAFPRRGDISAEKPPRRLLGFPDGPFYEFVMLIVKTGDCSDARSLPDWSYRRSLTAVDKGRNH